MTTKRRKPFVRGPRAVPFDELSYKIAKKEMAIYCTGLDKIPAEVWDAFYDASPRCECGRVPAPIRVKHFRYRKLTNVIYCSWRCKQRAKSRRVTERFRLVEERKRAAALAVAVEARDLAEALRYA